MNLIKDWIQSKEIEKKAQENRRRIEDELIKVYGFSETEEGTKIYEDGEYTVKIIGRMNRKVDADLLREISAQNSIDVDGLFKWTAEMKVGAWKNTAKSITDILAPAIVVTPGRASFSITKGEK